MTRKEAIGNLLRHLRYTVDSTDALIKALDQETCEDVISRQAVLDVVEREQFKGDAISEIEKLPPVTPHPNTGYWIANKAKNYPGWIHCSECGEDWTHDGRPPYCPACGARMIEEE